MKKTNLIICICLTTAVAGLFAGPLSHVLFYHEQHQLFLFDKGYFMEHLGRPEGLLAYVTAFIVQFFYYHIAGCLLMGGITGAVYLLNTQIIRKLSGFPDVWQLSLLPALALLIHYISIERTPNIAIGWLLCETVIWLILWGTANWKVLAGLWMAAGAGLIYAAGWLVTLAAFGFGAGASAFTYLAGKQTNGYSRIIKKPMLISCLCVLVYGTGCFYFFIRQFNIRERLMLLMDYHTQREEWDDVLQCSTHYRGNNYLHTYLTNLALYNTGRMPYDLFRYPQPFAARSLFFPWTGNSRESEYGGLIYAGLGYPNEAQRWTTEHMTVFGFTPSALQRLVLYNLSADRPRAAQRFANILDRSLFYKNLPTPVPLPAIAPDTARAAHFINVDDLLPDLLYACNHQPDNRMAFEYLMSYYLLNNQVVSFVENLYRVRNFSYPELPVLYQEALMLYKIKVSPEKYEELGIDVSEETKERFREYIRLYTAKDAVNLKRKFGDTYWYYLHFRSPLGSKIVQP